MSIKRCGDLGHVAPLPPKKPSKFVISSSIRASSASPGDPASASPCMGLGPISGPCDLSPKLLWSRAHKRSETLPLLTEAELVVTLMYLHLPPVVGHLLVNQVL